MKKCVSKTLLMMAFTLSLVGSFVSCKDYDEDVYVDLKSRITKETSLREALQIQVNELQAYVETLRSCQCDLQNYLTKQQADLTYMKISDYQEKIDQISANETAIALLQAAIDEINRKLAGIETKDDRVDGIITQISEMNTLILQVKALAEQALEAAQNGKCECNLEPLENRVKALEDIIAGWSDMITEVSKLANDGLTMALKDSIWIVSQQKTIDSLINEINNRPEPLPDNIIERLNTLEQNTYTKEEINNMISELRTAISGVQSVANQALALAQVNSGRIDDLTARVKDLEDAVDDIQDDIDDINDELTALKNRVTTLEGKVQELDTKVLEILGQLEKLQNDLQKLITGIIVQGTQSPVLGYFNAPLDTRSTVLAVYYGETTAAWEFPSTIPSNYVNGSSDFALWTPRKLNIIGGSFSGIDGYTSGSANQKLVTLNEDGQEDGNAGTIYVTVNPSNVDFTNAQLKLKDSQDGDAYATLSPLKVSDRLLTFGYTRAGNGFYEAKATITAANVENAALKVDYNELEEDAKTIWRERSKTSVLSMGASLVNMFQDMIPAYAVSGSWTDESKGTEHKIYSQYNVAATAIKPLSFAFMNDFHASSMPGIDRVYNLVDEVVNKINIKVNLGLPDFAKYKGSITFKDITLPTIGDNMFRITYNKTYTSEDLAGDGKLYGDTSDKDLYFLVTNVKDGRYALVSTAADGTTQKLYIYTPATGAYHAATAAEQAAWGAIEFGLTVDVDINKTPEIKQTLQDIIDSFNSEFGANSDVAKNITNLLNDVASLGNIDTKINTSISDAKADIKSQINSLITRANNKLTSWFNRIPSMLNLALVGGKDSQIGLLSQSKANATNASGSLKLVPTTYSLELLAPAYKKLVVVSDVFNADGTEVAEATAKSMASAANGENMGKVITSDKTCTLNAGQSGYIYEITYTAIDYFGKVAIKHYYVRF